MAFNRPSLETLIERGRSDTAARLSGVDPYLRRSLVGALATVRAGAAHGLHGHIAWAAKQLMPDTAEAEHLARWAGIWKITRKAATYASGQITFTGVNGSVIPEGTLLTRADEVEYTTSAEATIASGTAAVDIVAVQAGEDGNAEAGVGVTLVSPISGVDYQGTATALSGGADEEGDDSLRARLMFRIQTPPKAGAPTDYEAWALEVPGVTRAWESPRELGAGTVTLRFAMDGTYEDGIPLAADVATVQAYLEAQRPVTAEVFAVAPVAKPLNPHIVLTPDTTAVRAAVQAELADLLLREAKPAGTILLSHIGEAVSIATGETDHVLLSPTADFGCGTGEMATLGTINWGE